MCVRGSMLLLLLSAVLLTGTMAEDSEFVKQALKLLGKRRADASANAARSQGMPPEEVEQLELMCHELHGSNHRTISDKDMERIINFFDYNRDGAVGGAELMQMKRFFENFDDCLAMVQSGM